RDTGELPIDVLDRAIPDRPALILDDLGHAIWTNSLGLEAAGIRADDPDPQGGVFHRDADSGRLTGLLLETAIAMQTIDAAYALGHDDTAGSIEVGKFADTRVTSTSTRRRFV
ncbi:MAG: putative amidohydrolase YtcJ, partial [Candidatus Poriferisodalaceae bacterium]